MRTHHPGKTPSADQPGRTATPAAGLHAAISRSAVGDVPGGRGRPLAAPVTEGTGVRLGGDFSHVPVYSGSPARALAPEPGALVYTSGSHAVAGDGGADTHILALQRSIGNAAVSRMLQQAPHRHGAGCGHQRTAPPAQVQRSAVHDVLASPGQPLPAPVQEEMQARLGADFSRVRVHTDAAARASAADLGARAYTSGSHVVIGDGGADRHTLAHELTHAIQQRTGPVAGTDIGNGLKLSDPSDHDEKAAEVNAARAMRAPLSQYRPTAAAGSNIHGGTENSRGQVVHVLDGTAGRFPEGVVVQRLMDQAAFTKSTGLKTDTSIFSRGRRNVTAVDEAFAAYNAVEYSQAAKKLAALDALIKACDIYVALLDKEAKRKPGVAALLAEAKAERRFVLESVPAFSFAPGLVKARKLVAVQDKVVEAMLGGATLASLSMDLAEAISVTAAALPPADKQSFVMDDVVRLTRMSRVPTLPRVTRRVLKEVVGNVGMIDLSIGTSGAGFTNKGPGNPKYFVLINPKKTMGSGERLGALAHELTHVSTSESYLNTKMMWAFNARLPDDQIKASSAERTRRLAELIGLIDGIPKLLPTQKNLLRNQLEYARRPNLMADPNALTAPERVRFDDLAAQGVNWSSLVEFDTNVNQCLVYMASWGVPNDEPFHKRLQTVARRAYIERKAARRS